MASRHLRTALLILGLVSAPLCPAQPTAVATRFVVAAPAGPAGEPTEIRVSFSIDGWPPAGRPLPRVAPGLFVGEFAFPPGTSLEYKFLRAPGWEHVEKAADNAEVPNRRYAVEAAAEPTVLLHAVARWADLPPDARIRIAGASPAGAAPPARASTTTGELRVHAAVHSPQLGNDRTVLVWLPPGYSEQPDQRYPVLYMHDGNNVFDAATAFTGVEWQADEAATRLIAAGRIEPLILVGVYNTPDRANEYTLVPDAGRQTGGRGDAYLNFLVDTVKPLVDSTYRTRPQREHTAIGGSSLGGLISLYAVCRRPDVFSRAAVVSPALFWGERHVLQEARSAKWPTPPKIWIDIGTEEGAKEGRMTAFNRAVDDCRALAAILDERGLRADRDYRLLIVEGGRHHESDWASRFEQVLEFLFASPR